jgi:hypothetical protein
MPEQCEACREDAAFLAGTDHDLFIFASSAKNRLGETSSAVDDKSNPGLKGPHVSPLLLMKWGVFFGSVYLILNFFSWYLSVS